MLFRKSRKPTVQNAFTRERKILGAIMIVFVLYVFVRAPFVAEQDAAVQKTEDAINKYKQESSKPIMVKDYYTKKGVYPKILEQGVGEPIQCGQRVRVQIAVDPGPAFVMPEPDKKNTLIFDTCMYQVSVPFDIGVLGMRPLELREIYIPVDERTVWAKLLNVKDEFNDAKNEPVDEGMIEQPIEPEDEAGSS